MVLFPLKSTPLFFFFRMPSSPSSSRSGSLLDWIFHTILFLLHFLFSLVSFCHQNYLSLWRRINISELGLKSKLKPGLSSSHIHECCQTLTKKPSHVAFVVQEQGPISFKVICTIAYPHIYRVVGMKRTPTLNGHSNYSF